MRLIDADAFTEYVFDKWMQNDISNGDWTTFREWMNLQETVVEFDGDINKVMVKGVEYFPQKTGKWIPCSERLPEYANYYLTSTEYDGVYCDFWDGYNFNRTEKIIAWMPLPSPYKGDES